MPVVTPKTNTNAASAGRGALSTAAAPALHEVFFNASKTLVTAPAPAPGAPLRLLPHQVPWRERARKQYVYKEVRCEIAVPVVPQPVRSGGGSAGESGRGMRPPLPASRRPASALALQTPHPGEAGQQPSSTSAQKMGQTPQGSSRERLELVVATLSPASAWAVVDFIEERVNEERDPTDRRRKAAQRLHHPAPARSTRLRLG